MPETTCDPRTTSLLEAAAVEGKHPGLFSIREWIDVLDCAVERGVSVESLIRDATLNDINR
jgi:hypothetical protein